MSQATIKKILETPSPRIRRDARGASFTLLCTVEEGVACRFASSDWSDRSLVSVEQEIVDELGWKMVEHSARRQVVIRCLVPGGDPAKARCECDRGDGFFPLEVTER